MILVTNDDGINSHGLWSLVKSLEGIDVVFVVAPDRERSAMGMAITLHRPLRARQVGERAFAVDGTPVDCVDLGVGGLLPERPLLLVSGVNRGQNLGHDVLFSGTIAAAIKGTFLGIPSMAVSLVLGEKERYVIEEVHFETAAEAALVLSKAMLRNGLSEGTLLNVNVPNLPPDRIKGFKITRQDKAPYDTKVVKRVDPRGNIYYWIGGDRAETDGAEDTDIWAVRNGYISITPLQLDLTDYAEMKRLESWRLEVLGRS
ncbi:TPA: 5'/3'-nucleotidase SurE [Candidatus Poribacteria bacterium]|nr:5'/3'-nucleotidase SurE [Candidatus Poribacteria bacterium]